MSKTNSHNASDSGKRAQAAIDESVKLHKQQMKVVKDLMDVQESDFLELTKKLPKDNREEFMLLHGDIRKTIVGGNAAEAKEIIVKLKRLSELLNTK